jgi:hypothetical protein
MRYCTIFCTTGGQAADRPNWPASTKIRRYDTLLLAYLKFNIFMAVAILIMFLWVKSPWGLVDISQRFKDVCCLHFQGWNEVITSSLKMETARFSETVALPTNPHGNSTQKNITTTFSIHRNTKSQWNQSYSSSKAKHVCGQAGTKLTVRSFYTFCANTTQKCESWVSKYVIQEHNNIGHENFALKFLWT